MNRSADRFSSQADRNSADSGAEIRMHGPAEWRAGFVRNTKRNYGVIVITRNYGVMRNTADLPDA